MIFRDILERVAGKRFTCASRCCGCADMERGYELTLDPLMMVRLILGCFIFAAALFFEGLPKPWPSVLLILSAAVSGLDVIAAAILAVMRGRPFDKCVLIIAAVTVGFAIGLQQDAAGAMLLFQIGSLFVGFAYDRTRVSVLSAIDSNAERAFVLNGGVESETPAGSVEVGAQIVVHPGEVVPCDGIILEGHTNVDLSGLGGSLEPASLAVGDEILSGSVNMTGRVRCEVTAKQADSAASRLLRSVQSAAEKGGATPPAIEQIIDIYAPATVMLALVLSCLLIFVVKISVSEAIARAAMLFALANPCAIAVAIPLIRLGSMAGAAEKGVVFENCEAMDSIAAMGCVAFDKAGTLSDGAPRVVSVKSRRMDHGALMKLAAHAMAYSNLPYAKSIVASYDGDIQIELVKNFTDIKGQGAEAYLGGIRLCAGSRELMAMKNVAVPDEDLTSDPAVYISVADTYAGRILLSESVRADAAEGIKELKNAGAESVVMFTSDSAASAERMSASLGLSAYYSGLSAAQKQETMSALKNSVGRRSMLYVRSCEALASKHSVADVDVCMCGAEALSQPETTDLMLTGNRIDGIATAAAVSRYAERFMKLTVTAAIAAKVVLLILAGFGFITLWFAAFIDAAAAIGSILISVMAYGGEYDPKRPLPVSEPFSEAEEESYSVR